MKNPISSYGMILATALAAVFSSPQARATNTTYYVDSTSGNDASNGTSTGTPWKTLTKINATTFAAGDKILLKKGGVWNGQLHPLGSGSSTNPITLDAYGTGSAPIVDGGSLASGAAVYLNNQSNWVIQNLEVTNNSGTDNSGTVNGDGTFTSGVERYGILVLSTSTQSGITIQDNYVHNVNGTFIATAIDPHIIGGIAVHDVIVNATTYGKCNTVKILGNIVDHCGREGITVWHERYFNTDQYTLDLSFMASNVVVQDNYISNSDADGIIVFGYNGVTIDSNTNENAGLVNKPGYVNNTVAGMWPTRAANIVMQYNESSGCRTNPNQFGSPTDGEGFDVDIACQGAIVQYNYSHDNQGGFIVLEGPLTSNVTVRYNLSVNDGNQQGLFTLAGTPYNLNIYNNTVYIGSSAGAAKPIFTAGASTKNYNFLNNLIYNLGSGDYELPTVSGVKYGTFDHNHFYGNHPAGEPADASKLTSDPLLVSPGSTPTSRTTATGYQLQSTSPAINSGTLVGSNGGLDFWANTVYSAASPNRGADNHYATNSGIKSLVDFCENFSLTSSHSSNVVQDISVITAYNNGADDQFTGDTYRFKRNSTATGNIVYHSTGCQTFSARLYYFSNSDLTKIKFYSSPNGTTWTLVTSTHTTPVATINTWYATVFTPVSTLPAGTNYLKVEFSDTHYAYSPELGQIIITAP